MKKYKFLSFILIFTLLISFALPGAAAGNVNYADIQDSWAKAPLLNAVANGLLIGENGKLLPDATLSRSELAAIITRAFGATTQADLTAYTDIPTGSWYAGPMAGAVKMGAFVGSDSQLNPEKPVTREEVFVVIARVLTLVSTDTSVLERFSDKDSVSPWALSAVSAMVNAGYIRGNNGRLNPGAPITRAEIAQFMDNLVKGYIQKAGTYTSIPDGSIMISAPGVTLKNVTVTGDLIIGDGVGTGECILDGVKLKGRMIVRGGGEHTVVAGVSSEGGENTITLLRDSDGGIGQVSVTNASGVVILNNPNNSVHLDIPSGYAPPAVLAISNSIVSGSVPNLVVGLSPDEISRLYGHAIDSRPEPPAPSATPPAANMPPPPVNITPSPSTNMQQPPAILGPGQPPLAPAPIGLPPALQVSLSGGIGNVFAGSPAQITLLSGTINRLDVGSNGAGSGVNVSGGRIEAFFANAPGTQLNVNSGSITGVTLGTGASGSGITVGSGGTIGTVTANTSANISGAGLVSNVFANASNVRVGTAGTLVNAAPGTTGVFAGLTAIPGGTSFTSPGSGSTNSPTGSFDHNPWAVLNSNAYLRSLAISSGTLTPQFSRDITNYTAAVTSDINQITVTAERDYSLQTIKINGTVVQSNVSSSPISLSTGQNSVVVAVYAENGAEKDYHVTVTKPAALSSNADLQSLALSSGTLAPQFSKDITEYTAAVNYSTDQINVTAEKGDSAQTVKINGTVVQSNGILNPISLSTGQNSVVVAVYAADSTEKDYHIMVTRAAVLSSNADLNSLSLSSGTLSPQFSKEQIEYTAAVTSDIDQITVTAEKGDYTQTVWINEALVQGSKPSVPVSLTVGQNSVMASVYAEDGTKKDYYLCVTKAAKPVTAEFSSTMLNITMDDYLIFFEGGPDPAAFTVTINGQQSKPQNVFIEGKMIFIEGTFPADAVITVSYQRTGTNDLTNGAFVSNFTNLPVTYIDYGNLP